MNAAILDFTQHELDRQIELEKLARERGLARVRSSIERAFDREMASETPAGIEMLRHAVEPAANAIAEYLVTVEARGRGRPPALFRFAGHCDPYLLAYLTAKVALDHAAQGASLLRTALSIGSAIEDELRHAALEAQQPNFYNAVQLSLRQRGSRDPRHSRAVWSALARKHRIEVPRWARNTKVQIGVVLFDLFAGVTGLVERQLVPVGRNKVQYKTQLTPGASAWFADRNGKQGLLRPAYMPTVIPPLPWTSVRGGGYVTHHLFPLPLIKRTRPEHIHTLEKADLRLVYQGLNAIQETAWQVNRKVLPVLQRAWDKGLELPCLPRREDRELPPKPSHFDDDQQARLEWRAAARNVHELNVKERGSRFALARLLSQAAELEHDARLYFPHHLDFRGRCYSVPTGLQAQGQDEARALLTFADAKPVDGTAERWLFIHGANTFGYDKVGFDDRYDWAYRHMDRVLATTEDPFRDLWWTEADKPWSFLAWCFEMERVVRGDGRSSLPIALDGSCNGLQHFAAMLRDAVGGAAVNLIPSDQPQDIYQRVADRTLERLVRMAHSSHELAWIARGWIDFGIDRKITKRPVMVFPYGATRLACLEGVRAAVREALRQGQENPFGDRLSSAEEYLAHVIWDATCDVVVAARHAMGWLQEVARLSAEFNVPLSWTTPSGFVAHQEYLSKKERRIKTKSRGELIRLADLVPGDKIDRRKHVQGIAPNFVHSMDAAAMMLTINAAREHGITQFTMIHDSYGTVAADTETLSKDLRQAFVTMYQEHDVLEEFRAEFQARLPAEGRNRLPMCPQKGTLDLNEVLRSPYFFS